MDDPFRIPGSLTLSVGEGYLSAFEVSTLKPKDVIRTTRMAGASFTLLFNGVPLAQCEVVILSAKAGGSLWGARISSTDFPSAFVFGPGRRDDIGELLPFVVSLGSVRLSLAELAGAGLNTIVSLGIPWSEQEDAELVVGGMPVARGKVVVIEEEMGLRITRLLVSPGEVRTVSSSGSLLDSDPKGGLRVKDYDFKRPDKFSKELTARIRDIHVLFLRNLRARLPALGAEIQGQPYPALVDQCTYGEATEQLGSQGLRNRLVVESLPWRNAPRDAGYAGRPMPLRILVEEKGTAHPVDPRVTSMMEEYLRAGSLLNRNALFLLYGEEEVVKRTMSLEAERDAVLACLRGGWRNVVGLNLRALTPEEAQQASGISPNEMVILVSFASQGSSRPLMALVYPYMTLEPFVHILGH